MTTTRNLVIIGIALLILGVLGSYLVAFDVTGPVTYDATFYGENWTITQPAPHSGYVCGKYGDITTGNSETSLSIVSQLPNTGSRSCDTYSSTVVVMWNRDLRDIQRAIIHRSVSLSGSAKSGAGWSSDTNGKSLSEFVLDRSANYGSVNKQLGDVIITNDGTGIVIQTDEGRIVLDDSTPQFLKNAVTLYVKDNSYGGTLHYHITGVDVTVKSSPAAPVVDILPLEETPATPQAIGWFARFLLWIRNFFS
jgi:hypothetical protein